MRAKRNKTIVFSIYIGKFEYVLLVLSFDVLLFLQETITGRVAVVRVMLCVQACTAKLVRDT